MTRWIALLIVFLFGLGPPAFADVIWPETDPEQEGIAGVIPNPFYAGRLEVSPIMSMYISGSTLVYRAGASVGYSITRGHQVGGSFVVGNRIWDRTSRSDVLLRTPGNTGDQGTPYRSFDDGFGSSLAGFYRYNIPWEVEERTFPFVELFGGRDFWSWGDISELGAGTGVRKLVSRSTAVTAQYAYSVLFANGEQAQRHVVTAGISKFFR